VSTANFFGMLLVNFTVLHFGQSLPVPVIISYIRFWPMLWSRICDRRSSIVYDHALLNVAMLSKNIINTKTNPKTYEKIVKK